MPWPNAGFVEPRPRIKQAVWDAFDGHGAADDGRRARVSISTRSGGRSTPSGRSGYTGAENVRVTNEETQAAVYGELVRAAACDPDVAAGERLRLPRRRAAYRVPGRARARRRDATAVARGGSGRDRGFRVRDRGRHPLASHSLGARSKRSKRAPRPALDRDQRHRGRGRVRPCLPARRGAHALERPTRPLVRACGRLRLRSSRCEPLDDAPPRPELGSADPGGSSVGRRQPRALDDCHPCGVACMRKLPLLCRSSVRRHPRNSQDLSTTRRSAALTRSPRRPERSPFLTLRASRISPRC